MADRRLPRRAARPAVVGEAAYVNHLGGVDGCAVGDGNRRWRFDANAVDYEASPVVVADGVVYAGRGDALYALSAADGTGRWRIALGESDVSAPTVAGGTVYLVAGESARALGRVDR